MNNHECEFIFENGKKEDLPELIHDLLIDGNLFHPHKIVYVNVKKVVDAFAARPQKSIQDVATQQNLERCMAFDWEKSRWYE